VKPAAPVLAASALKNARLYVTGAGSGIGRAIACRAAALGAQVGGCGRHEAALAETARLIEATGGQPDHRTIDPHRRRRVSRRPAREETPA